MRIGKIIFYIVCSMFVIRIISIYVECECDVIVGYWILSHRGILSEMDSGYYPTQMERRDWSDSFVYVTIYISCGANGTERACTDNWPIMIGTSL